MQTRPIAARPLALCALALLVASPAAAVMDINDRGPVLNAGGFAMRVTNIGVLGNAFYDVGLSFDPSFEYPRGTGNECLKHADLWVGALDETGRPRVSGGPLLEWRPTLDPNDRVRLGWRGQPGSRRAVDDDGDGLLDEEILNGKDDDGDGEVDEDLGFPSDEVSAADYVDDRPEAINYGYPNGEVHHPFGLSVHQEAYTWSLPGYDAVAGIQFTITNHGTSTVKQIYMGLLADLDSRQRDDPLGALNDLVVQRTFSSSFFEGLSTVTYNGLGSTTAPGSCFSRVQRTVPVVMDGVPGSKLPAIALVPFEHTIDPLAQIPVPAANAAARAPAHDTFRFSVFHVEQPAGQGGLPVLDEDRYQALQGLYPVSTSTLPGDPVVLVSCGPFPSLAAGQSISFSVALIAAPDPDSLIANMRSAAFLWHGTSLNRLRDSLSTDYSVGMSGVNGHEVCLEPPPGLSFDFDPHCPGLIGIYFMTPVPERPEHFSYGHCVWTDADCNLCTGVGGKETVVRWLDPGSVPPVPAYHVAPGDHEVTVEWDNQPEILLNAGIAGGNGFHFTGYQVYRLSEWKRTSLLPPPDHWQLIASLGSDTLNGQVPLATVTDSTVGYDLIHYNQKHYPIGRYRMVDREVLNGFDYLYLVTTVAERTTVLGPPGSPTRTERIESPLAPVIDSVVVPHVASRPAAGQVWVVPNPYRAHAEWDRPAVPGDPFGRHIDFMGLPKERCTIKIWTLAGDFVAQVDHDGSNGDGQASWNLISRNGQDVESGVYLFTVESSLGHQVGKFVLIR